MEKFTLTTTSLPSESVIFAENTYSRRYPNFFESENKNQVRSEPSVDTFTSKTSWPSRVVTRMPEGIRLLSASIPLNRTLITPNQRSSGETTTPSLKGKISPAVDVVRYISTTFTSEQTVKSEAEVVTGFVPSGHEIV
ncbi:MAG: hypothetical protein WAW90_03245 [Minisyncoccia bacterium]